MTPIDFKKIEKNLPDLPGVYQFFDAAQRIIYVGKAKNIKKRVQSYFKNDHVSYKTAQLVDHICDIQIVIVHHEHDALILENNLIKQHQPKYNIQLKDDKTFPYLAILKEPFPRLILTRQKKFPHAEYLGPFTHIHTIRFLFELMKDIYPLRTCHLGLTETRIRQKKFKVCLQYHIKKCLGPCEGLQTQESYQEMIDEIKMVIKSDFKNLIPLLKEKMLKAADELHFELAQEYKNKMEWVRDIHSKTYIESQVQWNIDVFGFSYSPPLGVVHVLQIRNGKIVDSKNIHLEASLDESPEEVLEFVIRQYYSTHDLSVQQIITPLQISVDWAACEVVVPIKGEKKMFLDLAQKNVLYARSTLLDNRLQDTLHNHDTDAVLQQLQQRLSLPELPTHIECFDNSNFQGSYPVSAMVCFKNGLPSSSDYRIFKVKTVKGIDDFATMKEAVYRRYKRCLSEQKPLPQLIVIDGGKGQLSAAVEALTELNLHRQINIIGLAKNKEEIFFPKDKESLILNYNDKSLQLLIQIRDEVHRFGLNFHRQLRQKGTLKTELDNIDGIGPLLAQKLLKHFGSVKNIQQQKEADIIPIIGPKKARLVSTYFGLTTT